MIVAAPEPRYVAPTLRDRIGRVWAPVYINGKGPYKLVLDTGANRTAVIPSLARKIGTAPGTNVLKVLGATGSSVVPAIKVSSIEVGDLFLGDRQVAIVPDVFGGAEGVLGADGLSDKRVHIDFKNDQISILRSTGPVRANGYTRIPVKLRYGHLLMFDVKLAGVRTRAMLDTGAQSTIGNSSLRNALAKRKRKGVENTIIGVTLDAQKGETVLAPSVELGDLTLRGMQVTFGDMYIFDAWKMTGSARAADRHGYHRAARYVDHRLQAAGDPSAGSGLKLELQLLLETPCWPRSPRRSPGAIGNRSSCTAAVDRDSEDRPCRRGR